ncbi:MAG TPA: ABC transporter substrate-binding protein, partial [Xanthobacteraceae bacterium]
MSRLFIAALAAAVGAIAVPAAHAQEKITLRYGEIANSARGISAVGISIAQRKGFFEREGIDFKVVGLRGTSFQVEELDKGNVEVANTAMPYLIQAVLKGSNSVGIAGGPANQVYSL